MARLRRLSPSAREHRRLVRLLKATAHVAPYAKVNMLDSPQTWVDTMKVIRLYREGRSLFDEALDVLERLSATQLRPRLRRKK